MYDVHFSFLKYNTIKIAHIFLLSFITLLILFYSLSNILYFINCNNLTFRSRPPFIIELFFYPLEAVSRYMTHNFKSKLVLHLCNLNQNIIKSCKFNSHFFYKYFFAVIADIAIINLYLHNHQESGLHADQCNLLSENTI